MRIHPLLEKSQGRQARSERAVVLGQSHVLYLCSTSVVDGSAGRMTGRPTNQGRGCYGVRRRQRPAGTQIKRGWWGGGRKAPPRRGLADGAGDDFPHDGVTEQCALQRGEIGGGDEGLRVVGDAVEEEAAPVCVQLGKDVV